MGQSRLKNMTKEETTEPQKKDKVCEKYHKWPINARKKVSNFLLNKMIQIKTTITAWIGNDSSPVIQHQSR